MKKYKTLDEFLSDLDVDKRQQVELLRTLILETNSRLEESIKWNAPSYALDGEDRLTFNLMNKQGVVKLVFHMGATRKEDKQGAPVLRDDDDLVEWNSDIRGVVTFTSVDEINSKASELKKIITNWLLVG